MSELVFPKNARILAVAPSSKGMGFAVIEDHGTLVDWGLKAVERNKSKGCLKQFRRLITLYSPHAVLFHDYADKKARRALRIRKLGSEMAKISKMAGIATSSFSREKVIRVLCGSTAKTKYELATRVAEIFPEELAGRLPPKRRPWMSEDCRMDIFDAVALGLMPKYLRHRHKESFDSPRDAAS